jgi:hypothetical protein
MPPSWVWQFLAFLFTPVLAAFCGGYVVNRWKAREDHLEKRFDELCTIILETADLASEYWSGSPNSPRAQLCEAKLHASLTRIAGLRVLLSAHISTAAQRELAQAEQILFREMTGDDFGVHNREARPQKLLACQTAAVECVLSVKRSRIRDLQGFWRRP